MRLYGKKFLKRRINNSVEKKTETRDGIVWDLDEGNFRCRVKIQGSNEYVIAHYPRNYKRFPYWLKIGNAVRILHRSGVRGYVEVIGEGRAIPTPVAGPSLPPTSSTTYDAILSGMTLDSTSPESLSLTVASGTYRIDGNVYTFSGTGETTSQVIMNTPAPMIMGSGQILSIGTVQSELEITDIPSAGYYRYDAFAINSSGEVLYIQGDESRLNPVKPDIPDGYLLIDRYILVKGESTEITYAEIGAEWVSPIPTTLEFTIQYPDGFPYSGVTNYPEMWVRVTVKDQYGQDFANPTSQWVITLTNPLEIGQVYSAESGYDSYSVEGTCITYHTFLYQRDQVADEDVLSIPLTATLEDYSQAFGIVIFDLLQA